MNYPKAISMAGLVRFGLKGENKMKAPGRDLAKPSFWQLVFLQSKVNGAAYRGELLPSQNWDWPKDTYFQQRLRLAKWYPSSGQRSVELGELFDRLFFEIRPAIRP